MTIKHGSLSGAAIWLMLSVLGACSMANARTSQQSGLAPVAPPPPPGAYDPAPGPFFVSTDELGNLEERQIGTIDNAAESWRGTKLASYLICYQAPGGPVDGRAAWKAIAIVTKALVDRGAKVVVTPTDRTCNALSQTDWTSGKRGVKILGVVRAS